MHARDGDWTYTSPGEVPAEERTISAAELDDGNGWTDDLAAEYLRRDGNLRVPCSRYGWDTESCIPAAIRLANLVADASGENLTAERYEHAMGLVVNDHEDVSYILTEHGGTPEDYALASYECSICGEEHGESAHGDPLVLRELHQRTLPESVEVFLDDAESLLIDIPGASVAYMDGLRRVRDLRNTFRRDLTDDERDEYAPEYLDDIDAILSDAGYFPVTNADQGAWMVYGPVPTKG